MAKKSEDERLIDEVKERAAFMVGCEPGDHCAVLDLGIEDTREAACQRLAAASACLNARTGERPGLHVIRALSSGVYYAGIAFGPYDTAQEAESAAARAGSALVAHDEKERRARHARQEAEVRQEIEAAAAAETEAAELSAIEQETEQAATDDLGR